MECMDQTFTFNQSHFATPVGADFGFADVTFDVSSESPLRHRAPLSPFPRLQPGPDDPCLLTSRMSTPPTFHPATPGCPRPQSYPKSSCPSGYCPAVRQSLRRDLSPSRLPPPRQEHGDLVPNANCEMVPAVLRADLVVKKKRVVKSNVDREGEEEVVEVTSGAAGDSKENRSPAVRGSPLCGSEKFQVLSLREHYEVERELGHGTYGKVVLARCRQTGTQVALKLLPKTSTKLRDFQREFQLSYFLSPHGNIIDTYNVAFETKSSYVFAQEHAPLGDLFDAIPPQLGMREADAKSVIKQLASALEFMHSKHLIHRDIKPENVLVLTPDFSRVKLMDFGMTRKQGSMVRKNNGSIPYTPPEVCEAVRNESVAVSKSADVWALAVLLFCMLTGNFPWENADIGDMYFNEFAMWQRRKTTKLPSQWRWFTPRAMKLFRKALEMKPERRCAVGEVHKYMSDDWTQKPRTVYSEDSGSSASGHMDELATMLKHHGIETRVDRRLRERRISEWLLSL